MPYSYLKYDRFLEDIAQQLKMNSDPFIFPYTLQYVTTLPYIYYLKNIFLWGLGPIISLLSLTGLYQILKNKYSNRKKIIVFDLVILFLIINFYYFIFIGRTAAKFMRYMLPIYPFFTILAGYGLYSLFKFGKLFISFLIAASLLWCFIFVSIYSQPHTRLSATEWILRNIPSGSTIAVEHWDDRIPVYGNERYNFLELTIYDTPDDDNKWQLLNKKLNQSDYLIIASNRLSAPLQKLSDCKKYIKCYPIASRYYQNLLKNKLSFKKVAEFAVSPLFINDQSADESFTVYDHPKILIYKKSH